MASSPSDSPNVTFPPFPQSGQLCLLFCNSHNPVSAAYWNDDWSCWLDLVQVLCRALMSAMAVSGHEGSISQHFSSSDSYILSPLLCGIFEPSQNKYINGITNITVIGEAGLYYVGS